MTLATDVAVDPAATEPDRPRSPHDGLAKLAAFTRLAETGDIEDGSVLALAVEHSPWFQEKMRAAGEVAWRQGFFSGRSQFRQVSENPHLDPSERSALPFTP